MWCCVCVCARAPVRSIEQHSQAFLSLSPSLWVWVYVCARSLSMLIVTSLCWFNRSASDFFVNWIPNKIFNKFFFHRQNYKEIVKILRIFDVEKKTTIKTNLQLTGFCISIRAKLNTQTHTWISKKSWRVFPKFLIRLHISLFKDIFDVDFAMHDAHCAVKKNIEMIYRNDWTVLCQIQST